MDIAGWLRSLGLEQYEPAFRENHVDETVLPNLTVEDLKDLNVGSIGHRRKLLEAIALLRDAADAKAPPPAPTSRQPETAPPASEGAISSPAGEAVGERRYLTVMGGQVAKKLGDGLLAFWRPPLLRIQGLRRADRRKPASLGRAPRLPGRRRCARRRSALALRRRADQRAGETDRITQSGRGGAGEFGEARAPVRRMTRCRYLTNLCD